MKRLLGAVVLKAYFASVRNMADRVVSGDVASGQTLLWCSVTPVVKGGAVFDVALCHQPGGICRLDGERDSS